MLSEQIILEVQSMIKVRIFAPHFRILNGMIKGNEELKLNHDIKAINVIETIILENKSNNKIFLAAGTIVGYYHDINKIKTVNLIIEEIVNETKKIFVKLGESLSSEQRRQIKNFIFKYRNVFNINEMGIIKGHEHKIDLKLESVLTRQLPYRRSHYEQEVEEKLIQKMEEKRVIERVDTADITSPVVLVKKPVETGDFI